MPIEKAKSEKTVENLRHEESKRKNIPTAEYQPVVDKAQQRSVRVAYERRNRDLDPQLVWRGKDEQDWSDLVVYAPPLYIQEKIQPKVLIEDLLRQTPSSTGRKRPTPKPTCSATSTASPKARTRPSSISTTRTGRTA